MKATEWCPFSVYGAVTMLPDTIFLSGDANAGNLGKYVAPEENAENNGEEIIDGEGGTCHHTAEFMSQAGIEFIIEQERTTLAVQAMQEQLDAQAAQEAALAEYQAALAAQQAAQ